MFSYRLFLWLRQALSLECQYQLELRNRGWRDCPALRRDFAKLRKSHF